MSGASDNYEMWRLSNILINKAREYKGLPPRPDKNPYKPPLLEKGDFTYEQPT